MYDRYVNDVPDAMLWLSIISFMALLASAGFVAWLAYELVTEGLRLLSG